MLDLHHQFAKIIFKEKLRMYELTDIQRKAAKLLVENVRLGKLDEEFKILWFTAMQPSETTVTLCNHDGSKKYSILIPSGILTQGSLESLYRNGLLLYTESEQSPYQTWKCTLTSNIFTAVDNNFNTPDNSFIDYLTPLSNPSGFDEALTKRCFPILATGGSDPILWDSAVRTAGVILEERLHDVGSIPDPNRIGRDLVNAVFGKNGTLASKFSVDPEREGYRELYSGIVGAFRNPSAHRLVDPSPEEGGAFIVFVNLLLKKLEDLR